jgi:hypothetical protein
MSVLIYFFVSFALGSYVCRGVGVGLNAWFDFFIATAMIFGWFAAQKAHMRDMFVSSAIIDRILRPHWLIPFAVGLILVGTLANEFIARVLTSHAYLQDLIKSNIRMLQAVFVLSGMALLVAGRQIAVNVNWLFFYGILASSVIPFSINLKTDLEEILDHDKLKTREEIYHQDVQLLRAIPGSALFEDALLGFDAGKQYLLDPFAVAQMIVDGSIPEQILTNRIREKYFGVIVLDLSTQKRLPRLRKVQVDSLKPKTTISEHWTDNTLQAITANYQLLDLKRRSLYSFYVPRINAS